MRPSKKTELLQKVPQHACFWSAIAQLSLFHAFFHGLVLSSNSTNLGNFVWIQPSDSLCSLGDEAWTTRALNAPGSHALDRSHRLRRRVSDVLSYYLKMFFLLLFQ